MIDRNARKYKFGTTDYVALLSFPVPRAKQRHRLDVFADTVLLDFEGHKVCAPIKYEEFLITAFGPDYMTPPPEIPVLPSGKEDYCVSEFEYKG